MHSDVCSIFNLTTTLDCVVPIQKVDTYEVIKLYTRKWFIMVLFHTDSCFIRIINSHLLLFVLISSRCLGGLSQESVVAHLNGLIFLQIHFLKGKKKTCVIFFLMQQVFFVWNMFNWIQYVLLRFIITNNYLPW